MNYLKKSVLLFSLATIFLSVQSNDQLADLSSLQAKIVHLRKRHNNRPQQKIVYKGIAADTPVKLADGYQQAQSLAIGNMILDDQEARQSIIGMHFQAAPSYMQIECLGQTFSVGPNQPLYDVDQQEWINASQLRPSDRIASLHGPVTIESIEKIEAWVQLQSISVEHELYAITQLDIITHNMQAVAAVEAFSVGCIVVKHAAYALLQVCPSLRNLYQNMMDGYSPPCPADVLDFDLPERTYFAYRYQELAKIKHAYMQLYQALVMIAQSNSSGQATLLCQLCSPLAMQEATMPPQISAEEELDLLYPQEQQLNRLRESCIHQLEHEIVSLQTVIAVIINEMLEELFKIKQEIDELTENYNLAIHKENRIITAYKNKTASIEDVVLSFADLYKQAIIFASLITELQEATKQLAAVMNCCLQPKYKRVLEKTSSIVQSLTSAHTHFERIVTLCNQKNNATIKSNIHDCLQFLASRQIDSGPIANTAITYVKNKKAHRRQKQIAQAEALKQSSCPPPKKPDDDDDKKDKFAKWRHLTGKETTNSITREIAKLMDFFKTNDYKFNSHGRDVYTDKRRRWLITADKDSHKGGFWKVLDSRTENRLGTYNIDLIKRIGD